MIQRIQTLWLALAALTGAGIFYFDLYVLRPMDAITIIRLKVADDYLSLVLASLMVFLPLVAIFFFRNRKRQKLLIGLEILCSLLLTGLMIYRVADLVAAYPGMEGGYQIAALLPLLVILFSWFAYRGIRHDEKLLRSVDRFR